MEVGNQDIGYLVTENASFDGLVDCESTANTGSSALDRLASSPSLRRFVKLRFGLERLNRALTAWRGEAARQSARFRLTVMINQLT